MPRKYVPAYTRKLALNSAEQQSIDVGKGIVSVPASFLTRFGGESKPDTAPNAQEDEFQHGGLEISEKASETYLRRISNAKKALVAQERLSTGYKRGLPRFLAVSQEDYKPETECTPRASSPSDPRGAKSRWVETREMPIRGQSLRSVSGSSTAQLVKSSPLKHWPVFCVVLLVTVFLLIAACLAGIRETIHDIIWHAQMKQLGLHPPYYLVKKTANYL